MSKVENMTAYETENMTAYEALDIVYERFAESLNKEYELGITWSEKEKWNEDINHDVYCGIIGDILKMACKKPSVTFDEVEVIKDKDLSGYSREREVLKNVNIWHGKNGKDGWGNVWENVWENVGENIGGNVGKNAEENVEENVEKNSKYGDYCLKELVEKIDGKNGLFVFREWKWGGELVESRIVEFRERGNLYDGYKKEDKLRVREWVEWKYVGDRVSERNGEWRKVEIVWEKGENGKWRKSN